MKFKRFLSFIMTLVLISAIIPMNIFADERQSLDSDSVVYEVSDINTSGSGIEVDFNVTSKWDSGYNAEIIIHNVGDTTIENWSLQFDFEEEISNIWNAEIKEHNDNTYLIKNNEWNSNISPNSEVAFGFSGACSEAVKAPENYKLLTKLKESDDNDYTVDFQVMSDWGTGYTAQITITNIGDKPIEGWHLSFDFDKPIDNIWNAVIDSKTNDSYNISNSTYNANISVGESVTFGFSGTEGTVINEPTNYFLSETTDEEVDTETKIVIDENSFELTEAINGIYVTNQPVQSLSGKLLNRNNAVDFYYEVLDRHKNILETNKLNIEKNWKINGFNTDTEKTIIKIIALTSDDKIVEKTIAYFDNYDAMDDDGDGLENCFEEYFGTDKTIPDTDGDGLNDYQELNDFCTDPLKIDTDNNGISDYDEDADNDNIFNGKELETGSNPLDSDSDNDYLTDDLELSFGTSLVIKDTNNNGITDYDEYRLGQMNAVYNESTGLYTAIFSADTLGIEYDYAVVPTVELTADAEGLLNFEMAMVEHNYMLNPSMAGYMGSAYDFTTSSSIDNAVLKFTYNEEYISEDTLNSDGFCPAIYCYDPNKDTFTYVENQKWENNTVSVTLPHFSIYVLVNKKAVDELWNRTIASDNENVSTNQIVFVIDKSGSMSTNDPNYIRTKLIRSFYDKIGQNDKIALVGFSYGAYDYSGGLTNNRTVLESAITKFETQYDSGGTYLNTGIEQAAAILRNAENNVNGNTKKNIFVLTDGYTHDTISDTYLNALAEDGIIVYTVGMGRVSESYLKKIASLTNGLYFYAETVSSLDDVFTEFEEVVINDDKNNDGLNDELTKAICDGNITTITGTTVFDLASFDDIMLNDDYDGDGLKNGEEIEIYYLNDVPFVRINSLPTEIYSDNDYYTDYEETAELGTNPLMDNYVINSKDILYVGNSMNFESGLADDAYLKKNYVSTGAKRFIDVVACGGKFSIKEMVHSQLLDFLSDYTNVNAEDIEYSAYVQYIYATYSAVSDLKTLEKYYGLKLDKAALEGLQKQLISTKDSIKVIGKKKLVNPTRDYKKLLKSTIKSNNNTINSLSEQIKEIERPANIKISKSLLALETLSFAADAYEDYMDSLVAVEVANRYKLVLNELEICGNEDIEAAAQKIQKKQIDLLAESGIHELGKHFISIAECGALSKMGIKGIGISAVLLAGGFVAGDSVSVELINSIDNLNSNSIDICFGKYSNSGKPIYDSDNSLCFNYYGNTYLLKTLWSMSIYAKEYNEKKYINYLTDKRVFSIFLDKDSFLYSTDESLNNAQKNRDKLALMFFEYADFED